MHEGTSDLDTVAMQIQMTRQSNTKCCIPLKNCRTGISTLPKLKAQEFPGVILLIMVVLGTKAKYLEQAQTRNVQTALSAMYLLWMVLRRTWMDKEETKTRLPSLIRR
jgi:hypothetical protein